MAGPARTGGPRSSFGAPPGYPTRTFREGHAKSAVRGAGAGARGGRGRPRLPVLARQEREPRTARLPGGQEKGCFTCHGPGGTRGMADPGHGLDEVPSFAGGLITMYAQTEAEIREWILDGLPAPRAQRPAADEAARRRADPHAGLGGLLSATARWTDLVAFVKAVSDFEKPRDGRRRRAGRWRSDWAASTATVRRAAGSMPNVRAFKGYIPSWDGADFAELVPGRRRDPGVDPGRRPARGCARPAARWFLERQPIQMPAYRGQLTEDEVERIMDYMRWLRAHPY